MTKSAVAVDQYGRITKVFVWASDELIAANTRTDDIVLDVEPPQDRTSYWDFVLETWCAVGIPPSAHYTFDYIEKLWKDTWIYDDYMKAALRKAKIDEVKTSTGGFTFNNKLIQSDNRSQMTISSMIVTDGIEWITADNSLITLTAIEFNEMKKALSTHLQTTRAVYNELKNNLTMYTLEQLKEYINES